MKILIIGSGGREHALAWNASSRPGARGFSSPRATAAPRSSPRWRIWTSRWTILRPWRLRPGKGVGLTIVGPEAPLVAGVVDAFQAAGLPASVPRARPSWRAPNRSPRTSSPATLSRPPLTGASPTGAGPRLSRESAPPSWSRPTAWPPARASSWPMTWPRARRRARHARSGRLRRRRRADGHRGVPGGEEASFIAMADGTSCPAMAGPDHKAWATATPARTPAAWAPTHRRRWSPRICINE